MVSKINFLLVLNKILICISILSIISGGIISGGIISGGIISGGIISGGIISGSIISGSASGTASGTVSGPQLRDGSTGAGNNEIGISAYINVGSDIDMKRAVTIFKTIESNDKDTILGTYYLSTGYTGGEDVYLYITRDGYIVAFYTSDQPASRLIQWTSSTTVASKFIGVIQDVGRYLGYDIDYRGVKYYDFRYPEANRIFIGTKSATESFYDNYGNPYIYSDFKFNIPSGANVYETSYSMYLSSVSPSKSNVAIDTNVIGSTTGVSGSITTQFGSYSGYVSQGEDHLFGILGSYGDEVAGALVVIYKDPSITVKGPDYYWDGSLEYTDAGQVEPTSIHTVIPTPIPTYIPTPTEVSRPTPKVTIPVPMPTEAESEELIVPTPTSAPPDYDASINLYGERTDVEMGQDILLKLSAVNYIFKKEPLHAQIILIPPSGMSVTATGFVGSGTSQYVTNFDLQPGDNKNIEINIKSNQEGTFKVKGRIAYYFGDNKEGGVIRDQELTIKVKPSTGGAPGGAPTSGKGSSGSGSGSGDNGGSKKKSPIPGFEIIFSIMAIILIVTIIRYRRYN